MTIKRHFTSVAALTLLVFAMCIGQFSPALAATSVSPNAIITWNAIAQRTAITVGKLPQTHSMIAISFAQAAVYNAVVAIKGGYQPYKSDVGLRPGASVDAAVATAAHDVLVHYFPGQKEPLDADYTAALVAITEGTAKSDGVSLGHQAAAEIIAQRQGDGYETDIGFTVPAPVPGAWQPPAGASPQTPWVSKMKPFTLESPDQFRPGPAPALTSSEWASEYNEVKQYGANNSSARTAEQTDVARFWSTNAIVQYNAAFKEIALGRNLDAMQTARLFAMGNIVASDALVSCFDAKYHELFWRPQFAIPLGDSDGNPDTASDPDWKPLIATPNHPEYPAAHGCLTSAEAEILAAFLGTNRININLTSAVGGLAHPIRHYERTADLLQEMTNARVWGGVHYRESVVKGINVGRKVAHWALERYFLAN